MKHQPFEVLAIDNYSGGRDQYLRQVTAYTPVRHTNTGDVPLEPVMSIDLHEETIFITKAQCMEFFGLVDAPQGLKEILVEASEIINSERNKREPIVDELQGYVLML